MKAFFNDETIKNKYVDRVIEHAQSDQIIKGTYWENGKGCAVGCTIHDSDHSKYETELGIPIWLARMEDRIFEGLPNERAMKWPLEFLEAVNIGADLNKIKIPILIFIVESAKKSAKSERSKNACEGVLIELKKEIIDLELLKKARDAAAYASADASASAYASTAAAAAASAYASTAAASTAAASAAYAADASAYAAASTAAASAARKNCYVKFADEILRLIKECK